MDVQTAQSRDDSQDDALENGGGDSEDVPSAVDLEQVRHEHSVSGSRSFTMYPLLAPVTAATAWLYRVSLKFLSVRYDAVNLPGLLLLATCTVSLYNVFICTVPFTPEAPVFLAEASQDGMDGRGLLWRTLNSQSAV